MSTHEQLITTLEERQARLDKICIKFGKRADQTHSQAAAALRELLKEREEYQKAVTALDESMKHVPVNEQLIKLNIELGTAKLEIRELRAENERLKFPVTEQEFVTRLAELHELGGFIKSFENMEHESEIVQRAIEFQSRLRAKLAEYESCHETAPNLLRDNLRMANDLSDLEAKLEKAESDNSRLRKAIEEAIEQKDSPGEVISILRNALEGGE